MAHGTKAYGRTLAQETIFGVQDMGELSARLGSIVTHDRRGNIIWYDDFECGHMGKWGKAVVGVDSVVRLRTTYARNGAFSLYLYAGNAAGRSAEAYHYLPYPSLSKYGLEAWACLPSASNGFFYLGWYVYTGTEIHYYLIRYNPSAQDVDVCSTGLVWHTFATGLKTAIAGGFQVFKLVADLITEKYARCIINQTEYDLSAYPAHTAANASPASLMLDAKAYNITQALTVYLDDVIVTQNEP